ncbi:DAK2 domain-containing protein [Fusibacter tunisiensis]|uniref:Dihydroxyacetone kinase-like predicted kinase n=1 Tax=Fusibacter tunisiensis TaxID=1008308 RepID=A0ABS2MT49_9FIRM|nr:DAK2 domain-containing protein [Fusibacter tunisiensis]MBM7562563.1 dihydroxyacetone kinase-like predicted kinase [Fusibacter tunisiensis]
MKKATINGKDFYDYLRFGAEEVYSGKDDLNRINVFPVKDGDTGTNLALTINSIVDETEISEDFNVVIQSMSDAAFESARGNSGIIFASFLNGFSSACGQLRTVSMEDFSNGATLAVQEAYAAVASPVEGTMLTVIREWADYIRDNHSKHHYFSDLLEAAYTRAKIALEETPEKLEVLKRSKVVDSGAKGFVLFLSGINRLLSEIKTAAFSDKTVSENPRVD